jgi:cysteinyl-tRNA synthetase
MPIKIYNTLTREDQIFEPLNPPKVSMYVCGITPYDETHLGHGRAYVVFDVVRRYLKYSGYKVNYIQNITDIDDKIIKRANELKIPINELTNKYIESYFDVMGKLNVQKADVYPRATEHIKEMITVIEGLVKKGYAYVIDGPTSANASAGKDVYFEVAKFKEYGKLSKRKLDDLKDGARVAVDERKRSPLDFALWKSAKEGEPSWDSPWGKGRPGWHIECSVMSLKEAGVETLDIHGGGLDLIFPHHENEIAQAECYTGKPFARYWIHNGFVNVNSEKMSKSLGNFFTLRDIFAKYKPMLIRFYLLSTHYRSPINFSDIDIENAKGGLDRIWNALSIVRENASCSVSEIGDKRLVAIKESFKKAMDNDFNTAEALASVFKLCDLIFEFKNGDISDNIWQQTTGLFEELVVNILGISAQQAALPEEIKVLASEMSIARKNKDYVKSDTIKAKIQSRGYLVEITKDNDIKLRKKV